MLYLPDDVQNYVLDLQAKWERVRSQLESATDYKERSRLTAEENRIRTELKQTAQDL